MRGVALYQDHRSSPVIATFSFATSLHKRRPTNTDTRNLGVNCSKPVDRPPWLLQRRNDARMLELRDVDLRQHARRGVDIEHLLDRIEIWRGAGIAGEIIVLEQVCIQHRYR